MLVTADGERHGSLGDQALEDAAAQHADELMWLERSERRDEGENVLFVDVTFPPPRLIVFGAVDFAAALCRLARAAGWRPFVVDPRARFAQPARFPDAEEVVAAWPEEAFAQARRHRPRDGDRRPHPRPEARRRGADHRAALAGGLHRRDGLAPRAGRAAASGCSPRASPTRSWRASPRRSGSTSAR